MDEKTFTIQELSDLTGLPRRTIHFYSQQGLLPPPHSAGAGAYYDETHLLRLQLIPILRQKGLRLDDIRAHFNQVSPAELRQILKDAPQQPYLAKFAPQPQLFEQYILPAGITLTVPANLSPADASRLQKLICMAQEIFSQSASQKGS